jgi:hypothetical protein
VGFCLEFSYFPFMQKWEMRYLRIPFRGSGNLFNRVITSLFGSHTCMVGIDVVKTNKSKINGQCA